MANLFGAVNPETPGVRPDRDAETQEGFASYVRREFERRLKERAIYEQQWLLNLSFIEGQHYAQVHKVTGEVYTPERKYPWEMREVFNHIAPTFETRIAKLTRNRPVMAVRPGSPDEDDVSSAKVSTKILRYNLDAQGFDAILEEAVAWAESCGTSFLKNLWNPARGPVVQDPMAAMDPTMQQQEEGGVSQMGVPIGDVETVVVPPFEMLPEDVLRPRLEDQRSIIHAKGWPVDSDHVQALVERYKMEHPEAEDWKPMPEDIASVSVGRGTINGMPQQRFTISSLKDRIIVIEYYERPSRRYPTGRFAIVIGDKLVHYGPLPYREDVDFPFAKIDSIRRTNCFWSKSVVERLIPVQRRYNAVRNRIAEYLNRVGIGQWTAEEGTVDVDELTNEPGIVVEHTRGSRPPQPVQYQPLPSTFMEEMNTLVQEIHQISGVHEVSHGQMPQNSGGSPSGVMLAQLQEQDDTRIATTQRYIDEALEKTGKHWLLRYKEFAMEQRAVPIVGKNEMVHLLYFDRNSIRSYNVHVEASSALASSPAARREMVFAMLDRGLFLDPDSGRLTSQGLQKVYELLEFGNWDDMDEDRGLPLNRAKYENLMMTQGQPVQVWPWEDHGMHVLQHQRYRQTEEFYELLATPEGQQIAALFEQHVQGHMLHLQVQWQQQAMANQQQGGEA